MTHVPQLIIDLALILGAAGITTLLFKKLKQPVVLGYIIAGLLVGPKIALLPTISDAASITIWAEIGVIFLLFALGLEFSFKKLVQVGGTAAITGIFEVSVMVALGYASGMMMGWSTMDSLFLGGIMAISSTTIIIRAFDELGFKTQKFAGLVLGVLVIEDLVAVLLMVLLSTVAVSQQFEGGEMLISVLKLGFFLSLWFLSGIFILPTFLKRTKSLMNDETMLLISLGLCFLMVVLAAKAGFSAALGAFIMGSILAETTQAEKIEHLIKPVKDLFGAVFFVSVGMLIDPQIMITYALPVTVLTLVVVFGKTIMVSFGALLSGQPIKQSVQAGMSMSQIGEFSFIIATLGQTLGVTSAFLYPIAVGVSVITTFTTPFMMRLAEPTVQYLERVLPERWVAFLNRYSSGAQHIHTDSDWRVVLKSYFSLVITNGVVIIAIILLSYNLLRPFMANYIESTVWQSVLTLFVALAAMAPFLWALAIKKINKKAYSSLWLDNKYNRGPLVTLAFSRVGLAIFMVGFLLDRLFSMETAFIGAVLVMPIVAVVFSQRLQKFYSRIEHRFVSNLNARELERKPATGGNLLPWDAHLAHFEVGTDCSLVGKSLEELGLRERFGVNIAAIDRGNKTLFAPAKQERLYPHDNIAMIGTDLQLERFANELKDQTMPEDFLPHQADVELQKIEVDHLFPFIGKAIRHSGIREATKGLVVGLERNGERILNPDSATVFQQGDLIWIVGSKALLDKAFVGR